jgi:hypothetical protein
VRTSDFTVVSVRLVAFAANLSDFKPSAILGAVIGPFGKRFNGKVLVLPFPLEAPPEIPRIQLSSEDGRWAFNAAPANLTSSWNRKDKNESVPDLAGLVAECQGPILQDVKENEVRVARLGFVIGRVCHVENPALFLIERFCNDKVKDLKSKDAPLRKSTNFEIHNHKRYSPISGLTVNSWVRCRTELGEGEASGFSVEQDINTLSEEMEKRAFEPPEIVNFYSMAAREAEEILRKYFP